MQITMQIAPPNWKKIMSSFKIAILSGDGIGPEISKQAVRVLKSLEKKNSHVFECQELEFGANAYFANGKSFPNDTKRACDDADAILKGPIGLSHYESEKIPLEERPERGALLPLRRRLNTYANFRPILLPKSMTHFSPLKSKVVGEGIDIIMIRELIGGLYFGVKERGKNINGVRYAKETLEYDEQQIRQILIVAFEQAMKRKKLLHNIHKNNVLVSSVLWNEICDEISQDYPAVTVVHMLVDAAATHLCLNPSQFDVMVMENMFGDILSDQGGGILGSLGLMPSACLGHDKAYYEPSHGSAPDIAGQNIANPYSMIGSVALMLEMSFGLISEAKTIWNAMHSIFDDGFVTHDLAEDNIDSAILSTSQFGDKVIEKIKIVGA